MTENADAEPLLVTLARALFELTAFLAPMENAERRAAWAIMLREYEAHNAGEFINWRWLG